ncbi:MAG: hypothetical protein AAGE88_18150 [Actinomycetota bacterium]
MSKPTDDDVFDLDAELLAEYPPFKFKYQGERYELPHPMMISGNQRARANELSDDEEEILEFIEDIAPDLAPLFSMDKPMAPLIMALERWFASIDSADDEGKAPGPSSATKKAAKRSKRTSPPKAKTSGRSRSAKSRAT